MFLIIMSYGEWDDHNEIPIMVAPTMTDARLIADDMNENLESEYLDYAIKEYGGRLPPDAYFNVKELLVVCADEPSPVTGREQKRRLLREELDLWPKGMCSYEAAFTHLAACELPWRFVVRLFNRLRRFREHMEKSRKEGCHES